MKKPISFLTLTLCLAIFVSAFGVSAADGPNVDVKINGISVPASGGKISGKGIEGSISYDASTQTLTLDNATLTVDGETGIDIVSGVQNIVLKGTNEIKWADDDIGMQHTAIKSQSNIINISGSGISDSLKITAVCTTSTDTRSNNNYLLHMPVGVSINNYSLDILLTPNLQANSNGCDFTAIHSASGSVSIKNSRVNIVVGKDKAGNIKYSIYGACIFAENILEITNSEVNAGFYSTSRGSQAALHGASGINITNSIVNAISDITNVLKFDRSQANTVIKDSIVNASTPYYVARLLTGGKIIIENSNVEFASGNYVIAGTGNISGFTSISYTDKNGNVITGNSGADLNLNDIRTLSVKTAHTHCVCGNKTHTSDVLHYAMSWTAWDSANSLPTKPGNYYLTQNVTLTGAWNPSGAYNLCLNGKTVTNSRGTVINLSSAGSNVSVCDCTGNGTISGGGARNYAVSVGANTAFDLHGGNIVSSGAGCVSVTRSTGSFNMYGGTVGTESDHAVDLTYGGVLNANGGMINGKVDAKNGKLNFGGTEFTSEIMVCHETPVSGTPVLSGNGQLVYYYNVSIGSGDTKTEITNKNKDDILGNGKLSFEYDTTAKKGTLTMNGVSLESGTYSPISASNINTLEIVLNGENRVSSPDNYCIITQNLIFSGDGSLSVTTTEPYSVCIDCTGDITVNGGNITVSSVSYAIFIDGTLTVNDGSIVIIATDEEDGVALDSGRGTPDISISDKHMMLTGKMPNGSDAAETATTETDKISAARYIKILNSVAISYLPGADGSGNGSTVNKIPGVDFTLAGALFTRTGYTQTGWAITDGGEKIYNLGGIYTGNDPLTLYPVWTPNRYTITFDTDGGSEIAPITQDYGTAVTAPAAPTKTGYTFAGWDTEIPATVPAQNITVKATWTINRYTITFDTDGGSEIAPITQDYGTTVTAPANPTKVGYTFAGWDKEVPATMPAENVTLKAKWTINKYTISFDTDGGSEIAPITQDYGTTVTAPANPTKVGYTFAGWDKDIPATMPAENITLKATWKVCDHSGNKNALTCANDVNCSVCGATLAALAHTPEMDDLDCSTPVLCKVCGQVVTPGMRHSFGDRWYSDETTHWHFCSNGLCFVKSAISSHDWVDVPALAPTKTEDGYTAHRECTVCGAKCGYEVIPAHEIIRGDFDDNGIVDKKDAIYLLRHTIMGELYPLNQSGDMNGDGIVDKNDAVYLLRYTLLPKLYPLK